MKKAKESLPCPNCGSTYCLRLSGLVHLMPDVQQRRYQCQDCGQKFLTMWQGEVVRAYGKPGLELERPDYARTASHG
ncbi:MAG: hypothetical protein EOM37_12500 [Proteobacteria bacterium]|nr:hypothetical protein [Pseudomonadota bacterium]